MRKHFHIQEPGKFIDILFAQLSREVKLDVLLFDDWLHQKHGEYEADGLSMQEAIDKFYSVEASQFMKSFL